MKFTLLIAAVFLFASISVSATAKRLDFDGDGITDYTAIRNVNGTMLWLTFKSSTSTLKTTYFGAVSNTETAISEDFDGDGKTDIAVYRINDPDPYCSTLTMQVQAGNSNRFYVLRSSDSNIDTFCWGSGTGRNPVVSQDFDGDGKVDPAYVDRQPADLVNNVGGNLRWHILFSGGIYTTAVSVMPINTTPSINQNHYFMRGGDFNGDGKSDFAVIDRGNYAITTYIKYGNGAATTNGGNLTAITFGETGPDELDTGDFDGDSKMDLVVKRNYADSFNWYILNSSDNSVTAYNQFGSRAAEDRMAVGYYDADNKADIGVARNVYASGTKNFYTIGSTSGFIGAQWGYASDFDFGRGF